MKKLLRLISLAIALLIVCFTFCGCDALDEMRANHAKWQNDDKTIISLNGKEYKLLPECEFLYPLCNLYYGCVVTEKDVPLLLAHSIGNSLSVSDDKNFLVLENNYSWDGAEYQPPKIFCVADRYDEIKSRIENGPILDGFCYDYGEYDEVIDEWVTKIYNLSDAEVTAVLSVISNNETTLMDVYEGDIEWCFEVYRTSEDAIFRTKAFDIVVHSTKIYLVYDEVNGEPYLNESATFVVPDHLYSTIYGIGEKYMGAMEG